ncbi:Nuclear receptor-binding protein [Heterocephalus glaber]|uniref:Nuclear receptor-binding protein n=1 Tax=Heterocephalus glaber TaxID=10181 RepID=G5AY46_HETGA|nr:Nuclear receptor-binding protein [Heterocephalus glaber]
MPSHRAEGEGVPAYPQPAADQAEDRRPCMGSTGELTAPAENGTTSLVTLGTRGELATEVDSQAAALGSSSGGHQPPPASQCPLVAKFRTYTSALPEEGEESEDESEILGEASYGCWQKRREEVNQRNAPGIDRAGLAMDTEEGVEHNRLIKIISASPDTINNHVKACRQEQKNLHCFAPEYGEITNVTTAVDIYSFGICAREMAVLEIQGNGESPYVPQEAISNDIQLLEDSLQREFIPKSSNLRLLEDLQQRISVPLSPV